MLHAPSAGMAKIDKWAEIDERERAEAFAALPWHGRMAHRLWGALWLTILIVILLGLSGNGELLRSLWQTAAG